MRKPSRRGNTKRRQPGIEGPLEDPVSVLHEGVDLTRSLLDEAELGTEETPAVLAEDREVQRAAEEIEEAQEAQSALAPRPKDQDGGALDPEELEERLEGPIDPAELRSLHDEELLVEALLDEGDSLGEFDADAVEEAVERRAENGPKRRNVTGAGRLLHSGEPLRAAPRPPEVSETKIDARRFRRLLEADQARLEAMREEFERQGLRTRSEQEDLSSLSALDQHPADLGTETFDRERDLSIREQVEGELAEVARALQRLRDGVYGRCDACGRPIGTDRLLAEPAARLCLDDQRELERELALKHRRVEL